MKTSRRFAFLISSVRPSSTGRYAFALAIVGLSYVAGQSSRAGGDQPADGPKTTILFDGKSLEGWEKSDYANPGKVEVEEGTIRISVGRPMTGITSMRKDLPRTNYELRYEAMRVTGSDFFAAATFPVGDSYITLVNGGWGGNVTGLSSLDGVDASENETGQFFKYENKIWYKFRVQVTPSVIRCQIDDKQVVAVNHRDHQVGTRIETRANQPLGFSAWDSSAAIRNIAIRQLTPTEIEATHKSVK